MKCYLEVSKLVNIYEDAFKTYAFSEKKVKFNDHLLFLYQFHTTIPLS